jgi:hypothetical protein
VAGVRPLEELGGVAWEALQHAYGPAIDVPDMLRAVASAGDAEVAAEVEHRLWCAVLHQGQVYDSTAVALPFVIGLLTDRPMLRPRLVGWLTDLAWVLASEEERGRDGAVAACRRVLEQAVDGLVPLLADGDTEVRVAVAGFLAQCRGRAVDAWPALAEAFAAETARPVRADLLISMAKCAAAAGREPDTRQFLAAWWGSADPAQRCVAACGYCLLDPADPAAASVLIGALPYGRPLGSYWGAGSPRFIVETLSAATGWLDSATTRDGVMASVPDPATSTPRRSSNMF